MNVLFLMINFQDIKKNPYLYTEIAEEFYKHGNNVYVATILERQNGNDTIYRKEYGLNILRIKTGDMFNVGLIRKGVTTISIPFIFKKAINKYFKNVKFDLVIYPTPPITIAPVVKYIKNRDKCKSYLILRDIFPQNAVDLGVIKNKFIYMYFRHKEKELYKISDHIGCMSQGNIDYISNNNILDNNKLELLYNWTKINKLEKQSVISYREKYGLGNKYIAIHGGNIGIAQELEFLVELIKLYKDRKDIVFMVVGKGTEQKKIEKLIYNEKLINVILQEYISSSEFENLVAECDLGLVNLNKKFTIPNFPSKTLTYFKAGIPILAAIDNNTDYGKFLSETESGMCIETGNIKSYKDSFDILFNNKGLRNKMGTNGRKFMNDYLGVDKAYSIITRHFHINK